MLELLHIENIAIIEEAEIAFRPGFNALTGETGAGKSIVIDAMSAVLGQRTSRDLIRTGASKAFVSALFSHVDPALCEELGASPDENGDLMLQREIGTDGKNVCRVGGRPVTVSQLRTLGSRLVNIHGQHDGQQLLDEEQHLAYLDSFGKVESLLEAYADKYNSLTEIRRKMNALQMDEAEKARRMDTLQYQINELERAKLKPGEEEELQGRRNLLRNAEKVISAVSGAEVEGRLDQLYRLKKKYGATVEDMLTYLDNCRRELDDIAYAGDALERLEKDCAKAEKAARKAAAELSAARKAAGETLSQAILTELQQLDMGKIRFQVDFAEKPLDATGMDQVRFLMSANLGEELKPINKIASGGELARIMLAMKNVLSEQDHVATMVFDEVDTGVSGRAAQKVAEKMARISRHKQVLCVTHLPQLAAMADTHFSVEKGEANGRTFTRVQQLNRKQRQMELSRLTGGSHVTETMLQGAEELLSQAEKFRAEISE